MALVVELSPEAEAMIRMKAAIRGQEVTEYLLMLMELDERQRQQNAEADDEKRSVGD
jgi:hypothetical protein